MTSSADVTLVTGSAGPGAFVPYTGTFAFSTGGSTTSFAAETFVGQILNNGNTNWVAGPSSAPYYLLSSSVDGATATTLADGNTYYYTTGPRPVFQELAGGSVSAADGSASATDVSTVAGTASGVTVVSGTMTSSESSAASGTESAASASSTTSSSGASSSGVKLSGLLALGLMAFAWAL